MIKNYTNSKALNILVLVKSIDGGTGTFLLDFLKLSDVFKSRKVVLKTLVLERPTYRKIKEKGFIYFRKKGFYPQHYSLAIWNFIAFYKEINWIISWTKKFKPQIIVSIDMRCNLLAVVSKLLLRKATKIIATSHIDLGRMLFDKSTPLLNIVLSNIIHFFYGFADRIVAVSNELAKNIKSDFGINKEIITIYNGIHVMSVKPHAFPNKGRQIIISVGRLSRQKDLETLITSIKMLRHDMQNAELWLVGDGPKRSELETLVNNMGLKEHVTFLGWIDNVSKYISKADIFVLSSNMEGFGYVLIEAMQAGVPVVSTDTPYGPREILGNGKYGVLVPMHNPVKMKKAMLNILTNKDKYKHLAEMSLLRCKDFSIRQMLLSYKCVIEDVIN